MAKKYDTTECVCYDHPSQDNSSRFERDQLLRLHGFKIHTRPNNAEPIWVNRGILFQQSVALRCIDPRRVRDAQYKEDSHIDLTYGD